MDNTLSVLVVEDEIEICNKFSEIINETDGIEIVAATGDSDKAIQMIKDFLPRALILDLELHNGKGNGFNVMQAIKTMDLDIVPYILVTTNNTSSVTYEYARDAGADFIFSKHQNDYTEKSVVDFLCMMKPAIQGKQKNNKIQQLTTETPEQKNKHLTNRIITELNLIGISPKAVGYRYLIAAIKLIIDNLTSGGEPIYIQNITTLIGNQYGKTESSVERAMQNAINRAWKRNDIDDLLKLYTASIASERGVPTITEFIYYYANKIKAEY